MRVLEQIEHVSDRRVPGGSMASYDEAEDVDFADACRPPRRPSARSCGAAAGGCPACRGTRPRHRRACRQAGRPVSVARRRPADDSSAPRIRFLVVCGLSETMASFVPTMRLSSVDLPALGRPMNETNPDFISAGLLAPAPSSADFRIRTLLIRRRSASSTSTRRPSISNVSPTAGTRPSVRQQIAADGLEPLALDLDVEPLAHLVDVDLAAEHDSGRCPRRQSARLSTSYSSRISPTISSSRSSMVTRPAVPPYSSTTMAHWIC